jgi:hypothetical protein
VNERTIILIVSLMCVCARVRSSRRGCEGDIVIYPWFEVTKVHGFK